MGGAAAIGRRPLPHLTDRLRGARALPCSAIGTTLALDHGPSHGPRPPIAGPARIRERRVRRRQRAPASVTR